VVVCEDVGVTPTTNFIHSTADSATVGVGNMITLGDTIAKVDEVVDAANYTAVEDTKANSMIDFINFVESSFEPFELMNRCSIWHN